MSIQTKNITTGNKTKLADYNVQLQIIKTSAPNSYDNLCSVHY